MHKQSISVIALLNIGVAAAFAPQQANAQGSPMSIGAGIEIMPQFFADDVVKGAPVTATITTKTVQELCDGNRIVHEDTSRMIRDSEGRVRRERISDIDQSLISYSVSDPASGSTFTVDVASQTVFKLPSLPAALSIGPEIVSIDAGVMPASSLNGVEFITQDSPDSVTVVADGARPALPSIVGSMPLAAINGAPSAFGGQGVMVRSGMSLALPGLGQTSIESLGQDTIDQVRVEGTLHVTTYAAGKLGNEKPIVVEKRSWFSPELNMMVRSVETDPRFGTVSYNAAIAATLEPDASLFLIPDGYKIVEPGPISLGPALTPRDP